MATNTARRSLDTYARLGASGSTPGVPSALKFGEPYRNVRRYCHDATVYFDASAATDGSTGTSKRRSTPSRIGVIWRGTVTGAPVYLTRDSPAWRVAVVPHPMIWKPAMYNCPS